jgi:Tol biopolymer transport system component
MYRVNADGSGTVDNLTDSEQMMNTGRISSDGLITYTTLVCADAGCPATKTELWVADADGSNAHVVVDGSAFVDTCPGTAAYGPSYPSLSPDGSKVAFIACTSPDDLHELYVAPVDTGTPTLVSAAGDQVDGTPVWSPDNTWVATTATVDDNYIEVLYNTTAGDSQQIQLSWANAEQFSADGSELLVSAKSTFGDIYAITDLYQVDVATGDFVNLSNSTADPAVSDGVGGASYSADGTKVYYTDDNGVDGNGNTISDIWSVNPDGSDNQVELTSVQATQLLALPNGTVAFVSYDPSTGGTGLSLFTP